MTFYSIIACKLFKKKEKTVPTLCGWFFLVAVAVIVTGAVFFSLNPFLSMNRPLQSRILVVEGWIPD
jgi:uncharacterized membrane protein